MPQPRRFTVDEYLRIERKGEFKSEFHQGQILAMAGGTPSHNVISGNIIAGLWPQLRGRNCRVYTSDQRTAAPDGEAVYYPDVSVNCGESKLLGRHHDVLGNPALVVEVLSRSTARYDRLVTSINERLRSSTSCSSPKTARASSIALGDRTNGVGSLIRN